MSTWRIALLGVCAIPFSLQAQVLWNNGPFQTGTGTGGQPISQVPPGFDTLGSPVNGYLAGAPQRVADNFLVTSARWDLTNLRVFAYQEGASVPPNPFSQAYVAIFDADPTRTTNLSPIFGSLDPTSAPNALVSQSSTGVFRVDGTGATVGQRLIYDITLDVNAAPILEPGEYWMAWGLRGSTATSIVSAVPVTPVPPGANGLNWGRTRYTPPGREDFWQIADGNTPAGGNAQQFEPYDHAFFLNGGTLSANQWSANGGGFYGTATNWSGGLVPNGPSAVANFLSLPTQDSTIVVASPITLNRINFNNVNQYTLTGAGFITMQGAQAAQINVFEGVHAIINAIVINTDLHLNVQKASSVIDTSSPLNATSRTVIKRGAGTWQLPPIDAGTLIIRSGTVRFLSSNPGTPAAKLTRLTIDGGPQPAGKLDLRNNALVIDYTGASPMPDLRHLILRGRNNGLWNGNGVISSLAQSGGITGVASIEGSQYISAAGTTTFAGRTVDATSVLLKYTYTGDTDLSGVIDFDDYARTDAGFLSGGDDWFNGDFDFNDTVDFDDYALIDAAFLLQGGPLDSGRLGGGVTVGGVREGMTAMEIYELHAARFGEAYTSAFWSLVPEPGSIGIFSVLLAAGLGRRGARQ
jgi:hypothetical protein